MEYKGKLYGKIGGMYFETGKTSKDWDKMESKIKELKSKIKEFPKFWYESNATWGEIGSIEDLKEKMQHQTDKETFGIFDNKDEFLDKSMQHADGSLIFGTRGEHTGKKTLRQFLTEQGVDVSKL